MRAWFVKVWLGSERTHLPFTYEVVAEDWNQAINKTLAARSQEDADEGYPEKEPHKIEIWRGSIAKVIE